MHARPVSWTGRSRGCEQSVVNPILNRIVLAEQPTACEDSKSKDYRAEIIEEWLVAKLSNLLGVDRQEIDVRQPFASYGLGSTEAVSLSGELADWLGRKVPADLAYQYPTVETLSRHLTGSPGASLRVSAADSHGDTVLEPIAIIGIGCRFPGSSGPEAFWNSIRDGLDEITEVPPDRFKLQDVYDPDPAVPGKINTRWGGFLDGVDQFDPQFFGISPREAERMDPQQRLLQEVSWEALEDAGQAPERIAGSLTGVFVGISNNDYGRHQFSNFSQIDAYAGTGNALSIAANRLSYLFDFRGPSIAVDTACSSSLVAVHLACSSLRNRESTLALAGGVNLILSPAITINFTKAGVMAPEGRCKAFDASANGYVRSEGAGLVVLKPLSRAIADGDPIYAVIRGSAVNQDGRSNGLMAPNPLAQESVLRQAYSNANVSPGAVQYVEAHGTGTLLGDPIEAKALGKVLASGRAPGQLCAIGSIKTNIGHCEAAAGIAGLIKVALSLKHSEIPASLHFQEPNPHIPFDELPLRVQTRPGPWSSEIGPLLAGVSSFGFGGTNAHVVLQQAPQSRAESNQVAESKSCYLLPLSARSPEALRAMAKDYQIFLGASESSLQEICYSASVRRNHHDYRLAVCGVSPAQLIHGLEAFLKGETRTGMSSGRKASTGRRKLVFVFSGQGSQWFGMGRMLLHQEAAFREAIERCELAFRPYIEWSLLAELTAVDAAESRLSEVDAIQPTLFAIQIGLAALWRSWGIEAEAVVGHSMGEVAAVYVSGALTLEDAAKVICIRSQLVKRTIGLGTMVSVELSLEVALRGRAGYEDRVSIAVSASPTSTVLSGQPAALAEIVEQLNAREIYCRMVKVDYASHSPQMDPLRGDLLQALEQVQPQMAAVPIYSTVLDAIAKGTEFDGHYWTRNLREPVLFSQSVQRMVENGCDTFLEIAAHPLLLSGIQQGLDHSGSNGVVLASIRRDEDERTAMLRSLGTLYSSGYPVDWSRLYTERASCVQLPSYPWQRQRCWFDAASDDTYQQGQFPQHPNPQHPLLGRHFKSADPVGPTFWEFRLDKRTLSFLEDHRIEGFAVLPASVYVEIVLAAANETFGAQAVLISAIEFHSALFLPEGTIPTIQVVLAPAAEEQASFRIYSCSGESQPQLKSWILHASGRIALQAEHSCLSAVEKEPAEELQNRCVQTVSGPEYYRRLSDTGIQYGPFFQSVTQLRLGTNDVLGELRIATDSEGEFDDYQLHPAIVDGCLQVLGAAIDTPATNGKPNLYLPTCIEQILFHHRPGANLWCHARMLNDQGNRIGDVRLFDETGEAAVEILGVHFASLENDTRNSLEENLDDWLYELRWQPLERIDQPSNQPSSSAEGTGSWLIFTDSSGVGESLLQIVKAHGEKAVLVSPGAAYERLDNAHILIRPDALQDLRQVFGDATAVDREACRGIVHLWSLDASVPQDATAAAIEAAQALGCLNALGVVQEMARTQWREPPRLWLVTRGAQAAAHNDLAVEPVQAPLWGLGRVIAQEHSPFWGGLVDLEPGCSRNDAARQLWEEISNPGREDQLAFRQGQRLVARLARKPAARGPKTSLRWRSDGSYLITGGLGDLGLKVAGWMAAQGARRLILLGRTKLPPRSSWKSLEAGGLPARQIAAIRKLEALGVSVHLVSADVADEKQLGAFLEQFRVEGWPPIRGVVHAAGVLSDGLLSQLDAAAMNMVLRPKMVGGWLLHRLLKEAPLDFFVVFSSAGSLMGQPGQGNYAAANAFLDALAHYRRAQGLTALSINWGPWAELGFARTEGGRRLAKSLELLGIRSLPPDRAVELMERLCREDVTQVAAIPVNWHSYRVHAAGSESALLSEIGRDEAAILSEKVHPETVRRAILDADPSQRGQLLQTYVSEQVARVLGLSATQLDLEQPLTNLGLDTLMAVELKNRITSDLGLNVPMVRFLQGFSVAQAAAQLLDQLNEKAPLPADLGPPSLTHRPTDENNDMDEDLLAEIGELSDEQVNSMLNEIMTKDAATE